MSILLRLHLSLSTQRVLYSSSLVFRIIHWLLNHTVDQNNNWSHMYQDFKLFEYPTLQKAKFFLSQSSVEEVTTEPIGIPAEAADSYVEYKNIHCSIIQTLFFTLFPPSTRVNPLQLRIKNSWWRCYVFQIIQTIHVCRREDSKKGDERIKALDIYFEYQVFALKFKFGKLY